MLPKPLLTTLVLTPLTALAMPALIALAQSAPPATLVEPGPASTPSGEPGGEPQAGSRGSQAGAPILQRRSAVPGPAHPSFDQSLDALVRHGVVTAAERQRLLSAGDRRLRLPGATSEACRSGALSGQECRLGFSVRWRGRDDGSSAPINSRIDADGRPLPPLTVPVSALLTGAGGSFRLADVFRVTPRPAPLTGNGNRSLLVPLIGEATESSGFGWRLHPLLGGWLLHAGRDLAAPEGTPVVAALDGTVISSGLAGGYGLAIEVEHRDPWRRTLYGHLSELYVQAGDRVRQGEVIGRVGSTGLSTGPHLHFEVRQPGDGGWVAVEPGELDPGRSLRRLDPVALLFGQLVQSLERPRKG
ncbi:MAG: M23 family metallopeptidase [Cyanobacteriota bacterium]